VRGIPVFSGPPRSAIRKRVIEIFEPGSPEYNRQRAEQELGAARAAHLMKARAAHLDLAARHLEESRHPTGNAGKTDTGDMGAVLQAAYEVPEGDEEGAKLLDLLEKH
jgi:hypothetical protein